MDTINSWVANNWLWIITGAGVVISICNAITKHWGSHAGLKKVLAFVVDVLSIITSRGSPVRGLKLPGQTSPPPTPSAIRVVDVVAVDPPVEEAKVEVAP